MLTIPSCCSATRCLLEDCALQISCTSFDSYIEQSDTVEVNILYSGRPSALRQTYPAPILIPSLQTRSNPERQPCGRQPNSCQTTTQPPRLSPSLHLPPADNLVRFQSQPNHRLRPLRHFLHLRFLILGRPSLRMASRVRGTGSRLREFTIGGQAWN